VACELTELRAPGDRRAFAHQLDHRAHAGRHVAINGDSPGRRIATKPRLLGLAPLFAELFDRRFFIAAARFERLLTLHHRQPGPLAQSLDCRRSYIWHEITLLDLRWPFRFFRSPLWIGRSR